MGLTPTGSGSSDNGNGPRRITLRAPIAGEVVERYAVLGQVVRPHRSPSCASPTSSRLWVELDVFERDLARVAEGNTVEIVSETHPGMTFRGTVSYVDATIDVVTRAARVRIEVENPERLLRPGQFVHARLTTTGDKREVISIPRTRRDCRSRASPRSSSRSATTRTRPPGRARSGHGRLRGDHARPASKAT